MRFGRIASGLPSYCRQMAKPARFLSVSLTPLLSSDMAIRNLVVARIDDDVQIPIVLGKLCCLHRIPPLQWQILGQPYRECNRNFMLCAWPPCAVHLRVRGRFRAFPIDRYKLVRHNDVDQWRRPGNRAGDRGCVLTIFRAARRSRRAPRSGTDRVASPR